MEETDSFNYRIINEKSVCVVIFTGALTHKFQSSHEECIQELSKSQSQIFILKFGDVSRFEKSSHRFLVRLQNVIRNDLKATIRICEIKTTWRSELLDTGIVKHKEYYNTLKDAIGSSKGT